MRFVTPFIFTLLFAGPTIAQDGSRDVMVVFDMSGSMWGQVDGTAKVEIARDAFDGLLDDWDARNTRTGLIAYGHRRRGDCSDIELLAEPGDQTDIGAIIAGLQPRGKTPLSDAVMQAAEVLKFTEQAATVVLLSDGVETCEADPCAVGAELEALGLDFTAHVIGFDIAEGDKAQLQCLANATGGQYFDAANARDLSEAMAGVAIATATEIVLEVQTPNNQSLSIRVRMDARTLSLPDDITIFGNDVVLGKLTEDTAVVPGLEVDLPIGPMTLRVEGEGISGEMIVDVSAQTEVINLEVTGAVADYIVWREGQLPVLADGTEQVIMVKNTTGVDRAGFYHSYLYPSGSTDEALRIRAGNLPPDAGVYTSVRVPSPPTPGDYDLVPTGTDGTEYARIPLSFAAGIDPVWQGPREVAPGAVFDAFWAGSSNRRDRFMFMQDGKRISRVLVDGMALETGFQLTAPDVPGIYDLVFESSFPNSLGSQTTQMGQIAVGVALPQGETAPTDPIAPSPENSDGNPDTDGLAEEAEAMGGEEFPGIPTGDLHGDWLLVAVDFDFRPVIATQINHEKGAATANGDVWVRAPETWNFGETTGHEQFDVQRDGDTMTFNAKLSHLTYTGSLTWDGDVWRGTMEYDGNSTDVLNVILLRSEQLDQTIAENTPVEILPASFLAVDERGNTLETPTDWFIVYADEQDGDNVTSNTGNYSSEEIASGNYYVTAKSGDLSGEASFLNGRQNRRAHFIVMRPDGEGADLPIKAQFFCSLGEDCEMRMRDIPVTFTLPEGFGAERPYVSRVSSEVTFNMAKMTPSGPFWVTLNQPQRAADLGPCQQIIYGTLCHDTTDDPGLLADVAMIERSLSFKRVDTFFTDEEFESLRNQLIGTSE